MASRPRSRDRTSETGRDTPNVSSAPSTNALDAPSTPTTVGEQLEWATRVLEAIGAPEPAREAAALLATVMGSPSVPLEPDSATSLAASHVDGYLAAIVRRTRIET